MPLIIVRNDITTMRVDAIVNAANESLLGGGGVDGCIHRAAGPGLLDACARLGGCRTGDAKLTRGYRLPCKYVIHTVGPVWRGGNCGEQEQLVSCYRTSLALAKKHRCKTVAFPLISSGVYGYPKELALRTAMDAIGAFLLENDMTVYLVIFDRSAYQISSRLFADIASYIDDHYVDEHTAPNAAQRPFSPSHIDDHYVDEHTDFMRASTCSDLDFDDEDARPRVPAPMSSCAPRPRNAPAPTSAPVPRPLRSLDDRLKHLDAGFSETLLAHIDQSGKKDSEIYKRANVDRKLFSKIRSNPDYRPSKPTALAFAIALELDLEETRDLISRAGYALSASSKFDVIIEYFISQRIYNIYEINEALFAFDQSLLGA